MKKLFLLLIVVLATTSVMAQQTVTFTLNQQPCNNNGVVTANLPAALSFPITVTWYFNNQVSPIVHTVSSLTDVLNNYSGAYVSVYAVGANNQWATGSFSAPPFTIAHTTTPAACPILGSATATITGGVPPYTYQWKDLATNTIVSTTNPANMQAGSYELTVTDAAGCVFSTDSLYIWSTSNFSVSTTTTTANCTNGTATVSSIVGGTPPYSYLWSNSATTSAIAGLSKGSYNVTVTDANGCTALDYAFIQQAVNIGTNITTTPATCVQTNGAVTAFGSGGMPPYSYLWSNNVTTQSQSNIPAGSYNVKITDANGCYGTGYANVSSSTPITVTQTSVPSSCTAATGSATLSISGGTAPYTVTWNTFPVQTGTTATNLAPGVYPFHVVDAVGCIRNGSVQVNPVNIITGVFTQLNPTCTSANGVLTIQPSGGSAPYTYLWNNSSTTQSITGLSSGGYNVTITDNAGCSKSFAKYLSATSPVSIGLATTQASCIFNNDGSITATVIGGTPPYTYSWSGGGNTNVKSNIGSGTYYLYVSDANGCTASAHTFVPYNAANNSCYCTISGTVYNDANANCVKDAGEVGIQNIAVHCSGKGYAYTDVNGNYSFKVPSGSYTISEIVQTYYPLATCQSNNNAVTVVASSGCVQTVDFANTAAVIHDMHVSTWKYNCPVPGFSHNMISVISNQGTVQEPMIVAGKQSDVQINSPSISPSVFNSGGAGYYFINGGALSLNPGASQSFMMNYTVPTNIPLNTSLVFKDSVAYAGPISNWINDYTPWNNVKYYTSHVVGSYDPNFKEVYPVGVGTTGLITPKDSILEYMVHFQNLGNYHATNVVVVDTLDADLDWTTMRPLYKSHPGVVTLSETGVATFTFNNINLPAKMFDEPGSNGMFTYTIRTKKNLPLGTQFTNSAAIYFDFNEPIITNTTLNTLHDPQSVQTIPGANGSFSVYPNPANQTLYARIQTEAANTRTDIKVIDVSGKVLISKNMTLNAGTQTIQLGVESLTPGIYFINLSGNGKSETQKFVIMK